MSFPLFVLASFAALVYFTTQKLKKGRSLGYAVLLPTSSLSLATFVFSWIVPGAIPLPPGIIKALPIITIVTLIIAMVFAIRDKLCTTAEP